MPKRNADYIPPHTHCKVCGRPIPLGKVYCSKECMEKDMKQQKRAKRMMQIYIISISALFAALLMYSLYVSA